MIDIYPGKPATATAANNVVRCLLGAAATAAIGPMSDVMGNGWAYTVLGVISIGSSIGPLAAMKYGVRWRREKREKQQRKETAKDAEK